MFGSNDIYAEATKNASINIEERKIERRELSMSTLFTVSLVFAIVYLGMKYLTHDSSLSSSPISVHKTNVMGVTHTHLSTNQEDNYLNILNSMDVEPLLETSRLNPSYQSSLSQQMSRIVDSSSEIETSAYTQALSKEILKTVVTPITHKVITPSVDVLYQAELNRAMSMVVDFSVESDDKQYIEALSKEI